MLRFWDLYFHTTENKGHTTQPNHLLIFGGEDCDTHRWNSCLLFTFDDFDDLATHRLSLTEFDLSLMFDFFVSCSLLCDFWRDFVW